MYNVTMSPILHSLHVAMVECACGHGGMFNSLLINGPCKLSPIDNP